MRCHRLGARFTRCHFLCQWHVVGPQVLCNFRPTWLRSGGAPFLGLDEFSRTAHRSQETLKCPSFLKGMVEFTEEQQGEVKSGRGPRARPSFPVELGGTSSPDTSGFTQLESLRPGATGVFPEAPSRRQERSRTSLLKRMEGRAGNSGLLTRGLCFPVTRCPSRTSRHLTERRTLLSPGALGGCPKAPCQERGSEAAPSTFLFFPGRAGSPAPQAL